MDGVRVYGEALATVAAGDRVAHIAADGAETTFDAGEEIGRAALVNRVVAGLPADVGWVAVTAASIVWPDGAVAALRAAAPHRAGLLGPRLRDAGGAALASSGPLPPTGGRSVLARLRGRRVAAVPVGAGVTGWLDGRCVLLRRSAWDSVDGYDTRAGPDRGTLDIDLGSRLARAGWLVLGVPEVEVVVPTAGGHGMLDG